MAYNGFVFKSSDRGKSFTKTALAKVAMNPNDGSRTMGRRMAVDPANPDVVYFGSTSDGFFSTVDGGRTWTKRADVPAAKSQGGVVVAFDRSSGTDGGKTKRIYASSTGNGVFVSTDAGANFTLMPGSPTSHYHMVVGGDGVLWMTEAVAGENLRQFKSGAWKTITGVPNRGAWHSVAVDPANANHVVVASGGAALLITSDGGTTWAFATAKAPVGAGNRIATDIPWLAWTEETYLSNGDMQFDPSGTNKLYFAQGIGVWYTNPPSVSAPHDWISQSKGIEQLVSNHILASPGGKTLYLAWDRPIFTVNNPDVFPTQHGPNKKHSILMGWDADYSLSDGKFIVALMNWWNRDESGYSTDGGETWNKFGSVPPEVLVSGGKVGGGIAVSTPDNIVWVSNNRGNPWYTKDRGATWTKIVIPGVPDSGGWGWAYYLNRHIVTADKVTAGTFYMYNYATECVGVYRSTNGGVDWTRVYSSEIASGSSFNAKMSAVPGKAGHLFFTSGEQNSPTNPGSTKFMRSTDGGSTWTAVPDVLEVYSFGFGKAKTANGYPTIFVAGYVKSEWGIWRSDDDGATWVKIGAQPLGNFDMIKSVAGDMNVFGRCYVAFSGSGASYGELVSG